MARQIRNGGVIITFSSGVKNQIEMIPELIKSFLEEHKDLGAVGRVARAKDIDGKWIFTSSIGLFVLIFMVKLVGKNSYILDVEINNSHSDSKVLAFVLQSLRNRLTEFFTKKGL